MQMKRNNKALPCIFCMVLIVAMALFTTGCSGNKDNSSKESSQVTENSQMESTSQDQTQGDITTVGEGDTEFLFSAFDKEGKETKFEIHTNQTVVGEALQELELIDGTDEAYGLYVRTVNGMTLDYNEDGYYWAFYVDGEYAMTGVDQTDITPGASYSLKAEK